MIDLGMIVSNAIEVGILQAKQLRTMGLIGSLELAIVAGIAEARVFEQIGCKKLGEPDEWKYPYDVIAFDKAELTAREGMSSREIQLMHPALLVPGDVKYWGSAIQDRIVVAISGLDSWWDEAIAKAILACILAQIETEQKKQLVDKSTNSYS